MTWAPSAGVWSAPAEAVGASLSADTVITTVSAAPSCPFAVQTNCRVVLYPAIWLDAVKLGAAVFALLIVCVVPEDTVHAYVMVSLSTSLEPVPSSVTVAPSATD